MEDNELELRLSAKQLREILASGLSETFEINGEVVDFKIIGDRVVIVIKLDD